MCNTPTHATTQLVSGHGLVLSFCYKHGVGTFVLLPEYDLTKFNYVHKSFTTLSDFMDEESPTTKII